MNEKIEKLNALIKNLEAAQAQLDSAGAELNSLAEHFIKHRNIEALTRTLIVELIDKILVHE